MATIDIVKEILSENLDIDAETVTPEATFDGLGIDSLDMVELISEIEDRCEIEFGEPECRETIEQLCSYLGGWKWFRCSAERRTGPPLRSNLTAG